MPDDMVAVVHIGQAIISPWEGIGSSHGMKGEDRAASGPFFTSYSQPLLTSDCLDFLPGYHLVELVV